MDAAVTTSGRHPAADPTGLRPADNSEPRSWKAAPFWAVALSVMFWLVYATCNWIAARRPDVPNFFFSWERHIPLVPLMIIPYMSIDLFFFFSPWVCTTRQEMRRHAARMVMAYLVAAVFFLRFPLHFAFDRQPVDGFLGAVFGFLSGVDRPYNLAPSLHIAIRGILLPVYMRHTRGPLRWFLYVWFLLIFVSTLLTLQHHTLDVITGQILALACVWAIPYPAREEARAELDSRRAKVAWAYGLPAAIVLGTALAIGGWWLLLLWPAFGMAMMAAAYARLGPAVFQKTDGRLPLPTRVFLGPYLAGTQLSYLWLRRGVQAYVEVAPNLLIGRKLNDREARALIDSGCVAVLDLTAEYDENSLLRDLVYCNIPVLDMTPPSPEQVAAALRFIEQHIGRGKLYVHCALGYSRSACIAAAYLFRSGRCATVESAIAQVVAARPAVVMPMANRALLQDVQTGSRRTMR